MIWKIVSCVGLTILGTTYALPQSERPKDFKYEVIVVGAGASGIVAATRFAEAGMKTLLVESGGPFFARDGGQAIQPWQRLIDPNTNITRHDGLSFFSFGLPTGPGASAFYDSSVPALAPKGLGGGTGVNGAQQFWPPRRYLDKYFGFQGWTANDFQPALRRVERGIPTTPAISEICTITHLLLSPSSLMTLPAFPKMT